MASRTLRGLGSPRVTQEELATIMECLNRRSRKRLNWKTPHQIFMQSFNRGVLRG